MGAAGPATSSEKSQQLVVPSRSYAFEVTGDIICPGFVQGIDHLRDPRLNKVKIYFVKKSLFTPKSIQSTNVAEMIFRRKFFILTTNLFNSRVWVLH